MRNVQQFQQYHQILFWPLEILGQTADGKSEDLKGWEALDRLERRTNEDPQTPYQEFVYFHPFAQQFLYSAIESTFTLHRRTDIKRVRIEFHQGLTEVLDVDRVHLYRFQPHQVAILVVEVSAKRPISRDAVLLLEDRFRQIYPPYWDRKGTDLEPEWEAGHCPKSVEWLDVHGSPFLDKNGRPDRDAKSDYGERDTTMEGTVKERRPPVCSHWRWLLRPLTGYAQIGDDRAPSMVFLMHDNPPLISRGDLVRHCFYDGLGKEHHLPYSESFLKDFEKDFAYTRFWNADPSAGNWMKTSYTCCGYGFTVIAASGGYGETLLEHFRHHYFQVGLLAHFHRSTLLRFSNRFNKVMQDVESEERYDRMLRERNEFATFISSSWFHEASNQEQGRELFDFWTKRLRTEELMKNILTEADAVGAVLSAHVQRTRDERLDRLTVLLYFAAAATFVVALLDSEVLRDLIRHIPRAAQIETPWTWKWSAFLAAMVSLALVLVYRAVMAAERSKKKRGQYFWGLVVFLWVVAVFALVMALGDR